MTDGITSVHIPLIYLANAGALAFHQHLYAKAPIGTFKDLAPVTLAVGVPESLVVHPSLPAKTVKDLVALAKTRPGRINYASAGAGGMRSFDASGASRLAPTRVK